jgi:hypothetical protein
MHNAAEPERESGGVRDHREGEKRHGLYPAAPLRLVSPAG